MRRIVFALAVVAAAVLAHAGAAGAVMGTAGPVAVTVTPTSGLVDGQAITIHAKARPDADLFEIRAHLCMHEPLPPGGITNTFDFGFDGAYCSKTKLSPNADAQTELPIAPGTGGEGTLQFKVGVGTGAAWIDLDGNQHTLTCGPGHPCDLVVQLQVPNNTVFYTVPLTFGSDAPIASDKEDGASAPGSMPSTGVNALVVVAVGAVLLAGGGVATNRCRHKKAAA
jgi:hypothetical protein